MNTQIARVKVFALLTAIIAAASWAAWGADPSVATDEYKEDLLAFGVAGIAPGQCARLNAITVGIPDIQPIELLIYDSQGNLLAHSAARMLPGRAVSLELPFRAPSTIAGSRLNRLEIYGVVRFPRRRGNSGGYVIPTLEVIDEATGKTSLMIADPVG